LRAETTPALGWSGHFGLSVIAGVSPLLAHRASASVRSQHPIG
jgi:hypothetical protein